MGLFNRRRDQIDPERMSELERQVAELSDARRAQLEPPSTDPPRLLDADATEASIDDLRVQLARIDEQLSTLGHRITSVATELANQIGELGNEIEHLSKEAAERPSAAIDDEVVDHLRDAQTKLANEQVRYQIALREELAELARRIKH